MEVEARNYTVAVMGAGTMGMVIAQVAASAGHPVMLYDVSEKHTRDESCIGLLGIGNTGQS